MHAEDFSLRHLLVKELPRELTDIDGKLLASLRFLLTRPGFLADEYIAGRRSRYISPLRLYLIVFLLHALVVAALPGRDMTLPQRAAKIDVTGYVLSLAQAKGNDAYWSDPARRAHVAEISRWGSEGWTILIFLIVAAVQKAVFRRRRYLEHAILAMSVSTFFLIVAELAEILPALSGSPSPSDFAQAAGQLLSGAAFVVYWFFAIRRFYGTSRVFSALAAAIVSAVQVATALGLNIAILWVLVETA